MVPLAQLPMPQGPQPSRDSGRLPGGGGFEERKQQGLGRPVLWTVMPLNEHFPDGTTQAEGAPLDELRSLWRAEDSRLEGSDPVLAFCGGRKFSRTLLDWEKKSNRHKQATIFW